MADPLKRSIPAKRRGPRPEMPKVRRIAGPAQPEANAKSDGYIPFRDRFRAWWDGVEPEAVVRKGQKSKATRAQRAIQLDEMVDFAPGEDRGAARVRICDKVWGQGFVGPGHAAYAVEVARPFSSRKEATVLDLSAGLGGRIAEIAKNPDVKTVGMERDVEFAENAAERVKIEDRRNLQPVETFNPDRLDLNGLKYDCIVARELFFTVADKLALLGTLRNGLRAKGTLSFTDFVLAEPDQNEGAVMDQWHETEPVAPQPWSFGEYRSSLENLNLSILDFEDDSEHFRELVLQSWRQFLDGLETVTFNRALVDALMQEAELWLHRIRAIESGQLRVLRVFARLKRSQL